MLKNVGSLCLLVLLVTAATAGILLSHSLTLETRFHGDAEGAPPSSQGVSYGTGFTDLSHDAPYRELKLALPGVALALGAFLLRDRRLAPGNAAALAAVLGVAAAITLSMTTLGVGDFQRDDASGMREETGQGYDEFSFTFTIRPSMNNLLLGGSVAAIAAFLALNAAMGVAAALLMRPENWLTADAFHRVTRPSGAAPLPAGAEGAGADDTDAAT